MPGPGGGAHGGGFGRGSGGRGFGGGFGGGYRGYGYRGFGFFPYRRGFGCSRYLLAFALAPFVVIFVIFFVFENLFISGGPRYDEAKFQKYADEQYAAEFSDSSSYDDNLLIVFLANNDMDDYYAIAWVGDNIKSEITNMFGDETTLFGRTVQNSVNNAYYAYSLDKNLASVMDTMADRITELELDSPFYDGNGHAASGLSHVTNRTDISISEETVNRSLKDFTDKTGIPAVIVVDSMEEVFKNPAATGNIIIALVIVAVVLIIVYFVIRNRNRNRNGGYNP